MKLVDSLANHMQETGDPVDARGNALGAVRARHSKGSVRKMLLRVYNLVRKPDKLGPEITPEDLVKGNF